MNENTEPDITEDLEQREADLPVPMTDCLKPTPALADHVSHLPAIEQSLAQAEYQAAKEAANLANLALVERSIILSKELQALAMQAQGKQAQQLFWEAMSKLSSADEIMSLGWVDGPQRQQIRIDIYLGQAEICLEQGLIDNEEGYLEEAIRAAKNGLSFLECRCENTEIKIVKAKLYSILGKSLTGQITAEKPTYHTLANEAFAQAAEILKQIPAEDPLFCGGNH